MLWCNSCFDLDQWQWSALRKENATLSAQLSRLETELAELKAANKKAGKPSVIDLPSMRVAQ
jgi:Tfp pilus assembly protein PilN